MKYSRLRKLLYAAMLMAMGLVLPFLTGQNYLLGQMLLLMHIPVLLCGFICGWPYGLAVGFITPLLRFVVVGAPPMPTAAIMAFELAAYGLLAGLMYRALPQKNAYIYAALALSMAGGRVVWGAVSYFVFTSGFVADAFTWQDFASGAVLTAWPGILIQFALIPALMMALRRAKILEEVTENANKRAAA